MKTESLHALILDRHLGELSPEAAELLELHLAAHPQAREEEQRILASLEITREAVLRHPELARVPLTPPPVTAARTFKTPRWSHWLARAALLMLALMAGFYAGRQSTPLVAAVSPSAPPERHESPWARYRMTFDPTGSGVKVVRVDNDHLQPRSMP